MPDSERTSEIFKFVNNNANSASITRIGKAGVFEINRHVQRVRQLRRQTQLMRDVTSTKKLLGWQQSPFEEESRPGDGEATWSSTSTYCRICRVDHQGMKCPSTSIDAPIGSPSDPFRSLTLPIDAKVHRILQYYMTLRQPGGSTADSNIAGFTPLDKHGEGLSLEVVKGALSSPTDLYAIALLAGMACRMKFLNRISLAPRDHPENYTVRAIQALRKHFLTGQPINDRVVFSIHNLSMAEYCCSNYAGAKLYWQMTRDLAIRLGGFAKFEPYIAWLCISADYLLAATTLTLPELDFTKYPRLSGLDIEKAKAQIASLDGSMFGQLRLQVLVIDSMALTQVIGHIHSLPDSVVSSVRRLVMANRTSIYRLASMPLKRQPTTRDHATHEAITSEASDPIMLADAMVTRARHLGLVMWLWYSSLVVSCTSSLPESLRQLPFLMANVIEIRTSLQLAERQLASSDWVIREDLMVWLCSLISLASSAVEGADFFVPRFAKATKELDIQSEIQLEAVLAMYPPLRSIDENSVAKLYWLIDIKGPK